MKTMRRFAPVENCSYLFRDRPECRFGTVRWLRRLEFAVAQRPEEGAVAGRPSCPLVVMITVIAASTTTALKTRNLAVFDAGTTSSESWLNAASKLAWKIATSSTLLAVTL